MTDIAVHIRIFEQAPTDDFVIKRTKVIGELHKLYAKIAPQDEILELASVLASGFIDIDSLPIGYVEQIEGVIKKESPSFVREANQLQIFTCMALGVLSYIDGASANHGNLTRVDLLSACVWSALSGQNNHDKPKIETLRSELLEKSRQQVTGTAIRSRQRISVSKLSVGTMPDTAKPQEIAEAINKAAAKPIDALVANAALDREEINCLWWSLSDWCEMLDVNYSSLSAETAIIISAIELSHILRKFPIETHKHLVFRRATVDNKPITLKTVTGRMKNEKAKISEFYGDENYATSYPTIFPLISGVISKPPVVPLGLKLRMTDWGARALLEGAILKQMADPKPKL